MGTWGPEDPCVNVKAHRCLYQQDQPEHEPEDEPSADIFSGQHSTAQHSAAALRKIGKNRGGAGPPQGPPGGPWGTKNRAKIAENMPPGPWGALGAHLGRFGIKKKHTHKKTHLKTKKQKSAVGSTSGAIYHLRPWP